jgi:putative endonuclease
VIPRKGRRPANPLGADAEDRVCHTLEKRGLRVLARNYAAAGGEIDLIAEGGGELHFVEVRARASGAIVHPAESVDARKRARIRKAAAAYLAHRRTPYSQVFLDVAVVLGDAVDVIVGAFE